MKDEKKRKVLAEYEAIIREACDVRRGKTEQAQSEFKATQAEAKRKHREAVGA